MQNTIESVRATISVAARQGASQARIQLAPASLGSIQIQLQRTEAGLVARVFADRPETAQALQQNSGELRRALEATGQPLLRLDISASGQRDLPAHQFAHEAAAGRATQPADEQDTAPGADTAAGPGAIDLPRVLVNVLA